MSQAHISSTLRQLVAERSRYRCAYCLTAQDVVGASFTIDHIVPESLGGTTTAENLCLACWSCNLIKGSRIAAVDPQTNEATRLFHPNMQNWEDHFAWQADGLLIVGLTPTGRATVHGLKLNRPPLTNARRLWVKAGWHPPQE